MLTIADLTIRVNGRTLLQQASITFGPGQLWAVLGRNGAGKTLLLRTLAGLRRPDAGTVTWQGRPIDSLAARLRARSLTLLLQDDAADYWGTVRDYVTLARLPFRGRAAPDRSDSTNPTHNRTDASRMVAEVLAMLELDALAERAYRSLSGGERQRVRLAQVLAQDTECVLLDEPMNHLDLAHQSLVLRVLSRLAHAGRTVVCTVHDPLRALPHCSHALLMYDSGHFEQGPIAQVVTRTSLDSLYGCAVEGPPPKP